MIAPIVCATVRPARGSRVLTSAWVLAALGLASAVPVAQEHPAAPHAHADAQKIQSPIASSPESIAAGAKIYAKLCVNCHGATGRGNGRLAAGMAAYGVRPSDLVDKTWQHGSSDGEIFAVIRDGIGPDFHMDAFQKMITDEEIWHVVNYTRSLAIK